LLPWKSKKYYIFRLCICSLRYPACKAYAPYCHMWPASSKKKISTLSKKRQDVLKKMNIKCVFRFSLHLFPETFPIVRRIERDMITNANRSSLPLSCHILMTLKCSRQIFEKYSNIKFHKIPFSGSRVFPCGRTDRQDEANSRFSQFCKHA
jgi:hypothetical protein